MNDLTFIEEEELIIKFQNNLKSGIIETKTDRELYEEILEEYKALLDQTKRIIKISDLMEGKLSKVRYTLDKESKIDFLTGLYNRRSFNEYFLKQWKNAKKSKVQLSVLMIDIDKFKDYNDFYGHLEGDNCLEIVSGEIKRVVPREKDIVARYGGEEFIVVIPDGNVDEAVEIAEKIRVSIENLGIPHKGFSKFGAVTVSIGVSTTTPTEDRVPEDLIELADKSLYRAKENGRNQVISRTL